MGLRLFEITIHALSSGCVPLTELYSWASLLPILCSSNGAEFSIQVGLLAVLHSLVGLLAGLCNYLWSESFDRVVPVVNACSDVGKTSLLVRSILGYILLPVGATAWACSDWTTGSVLK